jgi:hypothetical protein
MPGILWRELRPDGIVGGTWSAKASKTMEHILACGGLGVSTDLYVSHDGGVSWVDTTLNFAASAISGGGKYAYIGAIVSGAYHTYRSYDYGDTWSEFTIDLGATLSYIAGFSISDDGQYVVVGTGTVTSSVDYHVLYVSSDYGITWSRKFPDTSGNKQSKCTSVNVSGSGSHIQCVLDDPELMGGRRLYISFDYGATWHWYTTYDSLLRFDGNTCSYSGEIIIANLRDGFRGRVFISFDYGATFTIYTTGSGGSAGFNGYFYDFSCSSDGTVVMISASATDAGISGLMYSINSGMICQQTNPTGSIVSRWINAIASYDGNTFITAGAYGLWIGNLATDFANCDVDWWN